MTVHDDIARARALVQQATRIMVLTGAGISTDSGIPDFRGPQGVWTKNPKAERTSDIRFYLADPEVRQLSWQNRLRSPAWDAKPNAGHAALVDLERHDTLLMLATQNIDELHQLAGSHPDLVVELHGSMRRSKCWSCEDERPMLDVLERVKAGETDPPCELCGGILKSATISFGQPLDTDVIDRAWAGAQSCDLLLAVGSTLGVYPAAALVPIAKQTGAVVVIVNAGETGYDDVADVVIRESISDVLPQIVTPTS